MINRNRFILSCLLAFCSFIFVACASDVKKGDIPSTANPQEEITRLSTDLEAAVAKNIDVLAPSDFKKSLKSWEEAKTDLAQQKKQEEILNDLRQSRTSLDKAYSTSENREAKAPGLFEARQAALKAGALSHSELRSDLQELDSDVSVDSDRLAKVSADKLAKLQTRYIDLERRSVILNQLGKAQAMVNDAQKEGASRKAPVTFKKAELSLKTAQSVISTNVRNPEGYQTAVKEANADATLLMDVMATISQNGKNLSEPAALKLVSQNRQIKNLKTDLSEAAATGVATETALENKNQVLSSELATKDADLTSAKAHVELQRMIEKARSQFTPDEAEAYQQGNNLVIRLKKMNFASGRSDLPAASMTTLAKVSEVAKSLNGSQINIEGHTDSTGNESQNKKISEDRANSVATYLKSNGFKDIDVKSAGFGFEKPIATNKSKEGRAQNRRVDITITPEGSAISSQ